MYASISVVGAVATREHDGGRQDNTAMNFNKQTIYSLVKLVCLSIISIGATPRFQSAEVDVSLITPVPNDISRRGLCHVSQGKFDPPSWASDTSTSETCT
jgi:hypothetical protein